jgi:hypothetical protein
MNLMARATTPALLAALLLSAPAPAFAAAPDSGVAVAEIGPWVEGGGYPTIYWGWNGVSVAVTDESPGEGHSYTVAVTPAAGDDPVTASWDSYDEWDGGAVPVQVGVREDFALGTDYEVTVTETDGDTVLGTTAPIAYRHEAVGHPESGVLKQKRAGGKNTVKAGSKVRLAWTGSWEAGVSLTQVVYAVAKNGTFRNRDVLHCEGSYCPTRKGVRWVEGGDEPLRSFWVPKRLAGKKLIVVSYGSLRGEVGHLKAQWGWRWDLKIRKGS